MTYSNHQNFSLGILNKNHILCVVFHKGNNTNMEKLAPQNEKKQNRTY